jgi:hypothetical protein
MCETAKERVCRESSSLQAMAVCAAVTFCIK